MSEEVSGETRDIVQALGDIYDDKDIDEYWKWLEKKYHGLSASQLLRKFEEDPTCSNSYLGRESNIRVLAEQLAKKEVKGGLRILCVGCGRGPEPYELAMCLLQHGQQDFSIDGIDVSPKAIAEAKKGKIIYDKYYRSLWERDILKEMKEASLIEEVVLQDESQKRKKKKEIDKSTTTYRLSESVMSRISFQTHDIIEDPFGEKGYDVVVCNNVLQHYPTWTRELILAHILDGLRDGGTLVLERDERLRRMGITAKRYAWLKPYQDWKKDLSRFGLTQEKVESEVILPPSIFHRYNADENQFKGKVLAIRDRKLVEIPETKKRIDSNLKNGQD